MNTVNIESTICICYEIECEKSCGFFKYFVVKVNRP